MLSASFYIAWCTAKNRLLVRLRRLREPRYLIGAIAGIAYFYFAIFARGGRGGTRPGRGRAQDRGFDALPVFQIAGTSIAGLFVMCFALLPWVLPSRSKLLDFSQSEREFLFTAPVSRRHLLVHRLVRSQVASIIASLFVGLFAAPIAGVGRLRLALGFWVLAVTINVYSAAVSLTRARFQSPVAAVRRVGWAAIGLLLACIVAVGAAVVRHLLEQPPASGADVFVQIARVTSTGWPRLVLWPFIAIVRPPFSGTLATFVPALASALVVLAAVMTWMLLSDGAFETVAGEGGSAQANVGEQTAVPSRATRISWTLPLTGRVELALFWKGVMETLRAVNVKSWRLLPPLLGATMGIVGASFGIAGAQRMRGASAFVTALGGMVAGVATLFGPQMLRLDLRSDFMHLDLLKSWPLRAAEVIRGEMAWPVTAVSTVAWCAVLVGAVFSGAAFPNVSFVDRWSVALGVVFAAPAMIAAQYAVHNAGTILFPAWVQLGSQRTRGIDAMGQRLVLLAAVLVSLVVFALPGAIAAGVIWLIFYRFAGILVLVPMGVVFAAIVSIEVLAVTELLGPAYERIDVTSVERVE
jgi:ABC-2 type transport system permease protein